MQKIILVGRHSATLKKNSPTAGNPAVSEAPTGWLSDFRDLISTYEKVRWQGLNDGTESRKFVPRRMRLAKHYFDLFDNARLANDEASAAIMKSRLERMAFNHPRWGALL
ncbi:MAG: hypothetical protein ACRYGA_13475 [Janthinobacterium lividum]